MGLSPRQTAELHELLWQLRTGNATTKELARLERLVCEDPRARAIYVRYMHLCADLYWNGSETCKGPGARGEGRETADLEIGRFGDLAKAEPPLAIPSPSSFPSPLLTPFVGGPVFSYMVATVVLCLMLLGGWAYKVSHVRNQHYVDNSRRSTTSDPLEQPELVFVGRVTGMKDCRWSDPDTGTYLGASAPLGREYALASGLMEITYKSGARVILEGPCAYKVDSSAGGFLAIGKLTANIRTQSSMPKAQSSDFSPLPPLSSPLFSVRTPTAIITDLGTEFGVEVSKEGNTTSHVFSGSVKVAVLADSGNEEAGREVILGENESALVRHGKDAEDRLIVMRDPAPGKGDRFVRSLQSKSAETVRIVEKFASGKLGAAFEQMPPGRYVIVPGAAEHPRQEPLAPQGRQTRGYIRTVAADFCDRDFVFEATFQVHFDGPAHVPGTPSPHHVFFGLGDGVPNADYYDVVTCGLVLEFTADTGELLVRFRHPESKLHRPGDLGRTVTEMAPPGSPRPGRHRFRMSVTGKSVTFAVDADFDGEFQPDFVSRPIHLLAAGPSLLDATNSRLLVGTGNCDAMTVRFEELSITYVETKPQKKHNEDNQ